MPNASSLSSHRRCIAESLLQPQFVISSLPLLLLHAPRTRHRAFGERRREREQQIKSEEDCLVVHDVSLSTRNAVRLRGVTIPKCRISKPKITLNKPATHLEVHEDHERL